MRTQSKLIAASLTVSIGLIGAIVPIAAVAVAQPIVQAEAKVTTPDGQSMSTAAASCWEVKQVNPAAKDGIYWLQTPALVAPEQFYCDQTTEGGGWVLIGRGREGWSQYSEGNGTTAQVREIITGPEAFPTKQLSAQVIDGLLQGGRVDALDDGIRLRRATNQAGTTWQEMRMKYVKDKVTGWTWATGGKIPIASATFDSKKWGKSGYTTGFGWSGANYFVSSIHNSDTNYINGMGHRVAGDPTPNSYIWARSKGKTPGLPFSQMFLRPKLLSKDMVYPTAAAEPLPESTIQSLVVDRVLPGEWGVTGLANGDRGEKSIEVAAFGQVGQVMYVGGNFTHVLKNGDDKTKQAQSYIAAFDVNTGEWISTFRPKFDNQVKALHALPNGQLLVGGQFTKVNGATHTGLVALDPVTGEVSTTYPIGAYLSNTRDITVRSFDQHGDWLYVAGRFSALWGGPKDLKNKVTLGNAGRININTGEPDYTWNPRLNGTVASIYASRQGDRVYAAGWFRKSGDTKAENAAALSSAGNEKGVGLIPWDLKFAHAIHYQQGVVEYGNKIFLSGAQHQMFVYDRNTMKQVGGGISQNGGDHQATAEQDGVVYSGTHSIHYFYTDGNRWSGYNPTTSGPWTDVHKLTFTGAWSGETGRIIPEFDPMVKARRDNGTWALEFDSNGTMWMGGDFTSAVGANGKSRWVGGFMRFPKRDDVAPGVPTSATFKGETLSWAPAKDDRPGAVSYEVVVNGRVRYVTPSDSINTTGLTATDIVVVRTKDGLGNRSASSAPVSVPDLSTVLLGAGATWSYAVTPADAGWRVGGFDDAAWTRGVAPIGYGSSRLGTEIDPDAVSPRALAYGFRSSFEVADPAAFDAVKVTTIADDGVAVYVNGHEVVRNNLPEGDLTPDTYALTPRLTALAAGLPVDVYVPASYLVAGTNTIAVQTHINYRNARDLSMWASVTRIDDAEGLPVIDGPVVADEVLLASGSTWQFRLVPGAPAADWATGEVGADFAPVTTAVGYGATGLGTTLTPPAAAQRAITGYARTSVTIDDPAAGKDIVLTTLADDGVAIYVNGTEVVRSNLPEGPLSPTTYASAARRTSVARAEPVQITVPRELLVAGENIIAAEVHLNYASSADMTFDLTLTRPAG